MVEQSQLYRDSAGHLFDKPEATGGSQGPSAPAAAELDTDGNPVPTWKGHTYTHDQSGNVKTDTVTDGTDTWVRTFSYAGGYQSGDSGWVKQ